MNSRLIAAVAAVVLTVAGIGALVFYTQGAQERAFEGAELVEVLQATAKVPAGTAASEIGARAEVVELPRSAVPEKSLDSVSSVEGQVLLAPLAPGDVLHSARFGAADDAASGGEADVPKGLQEIAVSLKEARAIGGDLKPGQYVGVVASYDNLRESNFVNNRILILAVDNAAAANGDAQELGDTMVRLAVTSADAVKIAHAMEFGRVWLTRQGDESKLDRRRVDTEVVLK